MKIVKSIERFEKSYFSTEECLLVKFDIDLEACHDSSDDISFFVKFDKQGKIINFPNIKIDSVNPISYIALGRAIEAIVSMEGDTMKSLYERALNINSKYESKKESLKENTEYKQFCLILSNLNSLIRKKDLELKAIKKTFDKNNIKNELNELLSKRDALYKNSIVPIELELVKLDTEKTGEIAKISA